MNICNKFNLPLAIFTMTSEEYIKKIIKKNTMWLFESSLPSNKNAIINGIDFSKSLKTCMEIIPDDNYKTLLANSIQSLDLSIISQSTCPFRNSFSSYHFFIYEKSK